MPTLSDLASEMHFKKKTVDDLIRFIQNSGEGNPNYSLLLGAGCSIASGINSGLELVAKWRCEIYCDLNKDGKSTDSDESIIKWLAQYQSTWYDRRKEYSCLFEKKFDLPRQRRNFIENEIENNDPSIGYAFLVDLIERDYFRNIFTTNFDDLLNESFYRFSTKRPVVCAHDSSINSISVTSRRPKIIKLHGDYLFEDLKSTVKETESLEDNMKQKFIEFAKEYGLIVIGYGGGDRSIVDTLDYLLKRDEYLKNGIYWCFTKNSYVPDDLRKLLWKDRVYFVEIEGFDELFAEMHGKLTNASLPVERNLVSDKPVKIINSLLENKYLQSTSSKYLKDEIERLNLLKKRLEFKNVFDPVVDSYEEKSLETSKYFLQKNIYENLGERFFDSKIKAQINIGAYAEAKDDIEKYISNNQSASSELVNSLKEDLVYIYIKLGYKDKARGVLLNLIEEKPSSERYLRLAEIEENNDKKFECLEKAKKINPFNHSVHHNLGSVMLDISANYNENREVNPDLIIESFRKSIEINPHFANKSYGALVAIYTGEETLSADIEKADEVIESLNKQNPYSPRVIGYKRLVLAYKYKDKPAEGYEKLNDYVNEAFSYNAKYGQYLNKIELLKFALNLDLHKLAVEQERSIYNEYKSQIDDDYFFYKYKVELCINEDIPEAVRALENALNIESNDHYAHLLAQLHLDNDNVAKAEEIIKKHQFRDDSSIKIEIAVAKGEYAEAIRISNKRLENDHENFDLIGEHGYILLSAKRYDDAKMYLHPFIGCRKKEAYVAVVNYELARSLTKEKVNEERIRHFLNISSEKLHIAICNLLLEEKELFYKNIKDAIDNDKSLKYRYLKMPIFDSVRSEERFKCIFAQRVIHKKE